MSVLFAILALLSAIGGTFMTGYFGLIATLVFMVLTIVFAVKKRKENNGEGGIGSIVLSVVAVLIALGIYGLLSFTGNMIKEKAEPAGVPQIAQYGDSIKKGIIGLAKDLPEDTDMDKFKEDFDKLMEYVNNNTSDKDSAK